ncbi:hypothetical protein A3A46_03675 [Candidatus Roizmanbacteria bacterium RIFCSPLOWO2_01_FULL_37_13]|uniref:Uncharacterized protein n=1 Tax=Candidatus Roizmanbacteria bacterium RIFCSPHIGHO2_02_FULL_38_11 TaxID=1802039 RepID=A0A1F7H1M4_9BACT|nr:MAG: hypothetical protein A3C25_02565 [Candidatus Roizmanbacteria bacterium RIFCSPHIGHO2_02_FULL_38_11]OGK42017.1 MAG: hypothetical protein A3A46_03675 [Candidatus Roizmanbacteria bacterium RIFCSPLOWO2_01_FULL_37_13]
MKKLLKLVVIFFLILILFSVLVLGYLGFVPGVSALFGSNKPRDLGVRFTPEDLNKAQSKLGQAVVEPKSNPNQQFNSAQGNPVDATLTQEEYSAHVQQIHPVSDLQIKLSGSSFEISGRIDKSRIPQFVRTWGIANASDTEILNVVNKYLPVDPIFYISGTGGASNNKLTVDLTKAELGRMPVPTDQAEQILKLYTETLFNAVSGFSVEDSNIQGGQLRFKGSAVKELPKY